MLPPPVPKALMQKTRILTACLYFSASARLPIFQRGEHGAALTTSIRAPASRGGAGLTDISMTSEEFLSVTRVGSRFAVRFAILFGFASLAGVDFTRSFLSMLWMATILCAAVGTLQRESPVGTSLNHWDEAAIFGALFCAISTLSAPVLL